MKGGKKLRHCACPGGMPCDYHYTGKNLGTVLYLFQITVPSCHCSGDLWCRTIFDPVVKRHVVGTLPS